MLHLGTFIYAVVLPKYIKVDKVMTCFFLVIIYNEESKGCCKTAPFETKLRTISNNLANFVDIVSIDKQILRNNLI